MILLYMKEECGAEPIIHGEQEAMETQSEEEFAVEETVIVTPDDEVCGEEYLQEPGCEAVATPSLKSMKKAELAAFAEENNIELPAKATNAEMIATIEAALE